MGSQDKLHHILQVKSRGMGHPTFTRMAVDRLAEAWANNLQTLPLVDELVPARIVTVLEVYVREWVEQLVDHGAPFLERAASLKLDLKFDYTLATSLRGGTITLGQLVAHTIATSRFEGIKSVLDTLIADDIFVCLSNVSRVRTH